MDPCGWSVALVSQIDFFFIPSRELCCCFFFICIAMTPKCSLRHYKRQISFPEAKVLLRHTALRPSVTSLATQNERVWTSFESELVEGRGLGVPGSHRVAASIQTLQWARNAFHLCEAKRCVRRSRSHTASLRHNSPYCLFSVITGYSIL